MVIHLRTFNLMINVIFIDKFELKKALISN